MEIHAWKCPHCWGECLNYGKIEFYDNQCLFPRTCENCGTEWEERYNMEFIWHENVLPNNQKENVWKNITWKNRDR